MAIASTGCCSRCLAASSSSPKALSADSALSRSAVRRAHLHNNLRSFSFSFSFFSSFSFSSFSSSSSSFSPLFSLFLSVCVCFCLFLLPSPPFSTICACWTPWHALQKKTRQGKLRVYMRSAIYYYHEWSRTQPKLEAKCVSVGVITLAVV